MVIESRTVTESAAGAHRPITGRLVIATHNPGKLREMRELLMPYGIEAVSAGELGLAEPEETGTSFRGECTHQGAGRGSGIGLAGIRRQFRARGRCARRRPRHLFGALGRAAKGFPARHDNGGRQVARARRGECRDSARAHFVSALCVAWPDGHVEEFEATVDGTLVWPPRGDKGFGYDPMFLPDGHARTFGEMTGEEKHGLPPRGTGLSHRARAFSRSLRGGVPCA